MRIQITNIQQVNGLNKSLLKVHDSGYGLNFELKFRTISGHLNSKQVKVCYSDCSQLPDKPKLVGYGMKLDPIV